MRFIVVTVKVILSIAIAAILSTWIGHYVFDSLKVEFYFFMISTWLLIIMSDRIGDTRILSAIYAAASPLKPDHGPYDFPLGFYILILYLTGSSVWFMELRHYALIF